MQETAKIWMNGELVDWADAKIHVGTHGLHYGSGVFEGIRCYETADGPAVFRLDEHLQRLDNSARLLSMELPYTRRGAARGDVRAASARTGSRSATSGRSRSSATASSASRRATTPSTP